MYNVSKKLLTIFLIPILMTFGFKAHGQEVEEITGFDEGPIPGGEANGDNGRPLWMAELEKRGIEVKTASDELRNEAIEGFKFFRDSGSLVYNGRLGD